MQKITNAQVLAAWEKSKKDSGKGSIMAVARALGVKQERARRLILTAGIELDNPETKQITALYAQGMQIGQIAQLLGKTRQAVSAHLPYERGMTPRWTDGEKEAALAGETPDGRSDGASAVLRTRIKAPQRVKHDTPLRRARLESGLTQSELAQVSGVALGTIRKYEQGYPGATLDILRALADALKCDLPKLYEK